jgi:GH15 family glucan-1,4-alpha-glucosidase
VTGLFLSDYQAKSVEVIKASQAATGAYAASPAFVPYQYAWLRDGSFIAYAMDRVGEHDSACRFYRWCGLVLQKYEGKARSAIASAAAGKKIAGLGQPFLHARYTLEGAEAAGEWGNFQPDGYGAWLWSLAQHARMTEQAELVIQLRPSIELTIDYLQACWQLPHYDCWEEFGDRIHLATLAAVYGGCQAIAPYLPERAAAIESICAQIKHLVLTEGVENGCFAKSIGYPSIDASLLWLAVPFEVADVRDIRMAQTVLAIERELLSGCGVHRYADDTYYGGGQWILLSAWLGWYYAKCGEREKAARMLAWIEERFTGSGLPEQVQDRLLAPDFYRIWIERAGRPAHPLLWSHAMHLILAAEIGK